MMLNSIRGVVIVLLVSIAMLVLAGRSTAADPSGSIEVEITGVLRLRSDVGEAGGRAPGVTISAKGVS